jgi:hypothetical protein
MSIIYITCHFDQREKSIHALFQVCVCGVVFQQGLSQRTLRRQTRCECKRRVLWRETLLGRGPIIEP